MEFPFLKKRVFVFLCILGFIFSLNIFQKQVKGFFYDISMPLQSFLWNAGNNSANLFSDKKNQSLEQENLSLKARVAELQDVQKENDQLREALQMGIQKEFYTVSAYLIGKDPSEDIVIINKGLRDGLAKGMSVITPSKVVVGKIVEVLRDSSRVMLISDAKSSFDAAIQNKDILGLVRGKGRFSTLFDLIPKDKIPLQGDVVITTFLGGIFPKNLLVGSIESVEKNDTQPFQSALIKPFFDMNSASLVFVITQNQ